MRKFDVICSNGKTYECKRDRRGHETGNVAVEHKAIHHSQADYIVYLIDGNDQLLQIYRFVLWDLLKDNWSRGPTRPWKVLQGGEYKDWMTLIPINDFIWFCECV